MNSQNEITELLIRNYVRTSYRAYKRDELNSFYHRKSVKLLGILNEYIASGLLDRSVLDDKIVYYKGKMLVNGKV